MIRVFYGENRVEAEREAKRILGEGIEVFDAAEAGARDLGDLFLMTTLFGDTRKILIKDFFVNKTLLAAFSQGMERYLKTPHEIVILENSFNAGTKFGKELKEAGVELKKFEMKQKSADRFFSFNVYDMALTDGVRAVKKLREREADEDPYMMIGAWASAAQRNYLNSPSARNKRILKELAKVDMRLKLSQFSGEPWLVLEAFLLQASSL